MRRIPLNFFIAFLLLFSMQQTQAQRALPGFLVKELGPSKIQISWINPYPTCIQLAVQRSNDSLSFFRTIFSPQSPELPANGFVDTKVYPGLKYYYRIFYVLEGGSYFFSEVKTLGGDQLSVSDSARIGTAFINKVLAKPPVPNTIIGIYTKGQLVQRFEYPAYVKFRDSVIHRTRDSLYILDADSVDWRPYVIKPKEYISIYRNDSLVQKIELSEYKRFRDSITYRTKDTIYSSNTFRIELHPFATKPMWKPSSFVFTNEKGYISILLPAARERKYRIVFYEENGTELFQIRSIKETDLVLDKTNFVHGGWFLFDLFENDVLKERNKFYLQK